MNAPVVFTPMPSTSSQPGSPVNELDLRRIVSQLEKRSHYRYVTVQVIQTEAEYRVVSPCCSRHIDPDGGVIDIARIAFDQTANRWRLYGKDHARDAWILRMSASRLAKLTNYLIADPEKCFWQ